MIIRAETDIPVSYMCLPHKIQRRYIELKREAKHSKKYIVLFKYTPAFKYLFLSRTD